MEKEAKKIRDILSRKKIGSYEVYLKRSLGNSVEVKNLKIDSLESQEGFGFGIRINEKGRIGFSYGTDLSDRALDEVVRNAQSSALWGLADSPSGFASPLDKLSQTNNYDDEINRMTTQQRFEMALCLEETARNLDPRITRVRYATYADSLTEATLFNSEDLEVSHQSTGFSLSVMAIAEEGDSQETSYDQFFSPFFSDLKPKEMAKTAAEEALLLLGGKRISSYRGPLIIDRRVVSEILEVLASSTTAENVFKKNSFFEGKMGKKIYSSAVTLIDDGLYPKGAQTQPIDDEGIPSQTTTVIEKGIVSHFLFDRYWAGKMGNQSTGNAFRPSALSIPKLTTSNFYIKPGVFSLEELFKKMGHGQMITEAIGMHTAEPISGDFSVGGQGFEITGGKRGKPFRSVAYTGNIHDLFSKTVAVGDNLKFFGTLGAPSLLIEDASLSGD